MGGIAMGPRPFLRYGTALVASTSSIALTSLVSTTTTTTEMLAFAAVTLSTLVGGLGPGLLALGVWTLGLELCFVSSLRTVVGLEPMSTTRLVLLIGLAVPIAVLSSLLARRARHRIEGLQSEIAAERRFVASIVENIPDIVFVKDARQLSYVSINRAGEELLGWKRTQLLGKTDFDLFPEKEARSFQQRDRDVLASGQLVDMPEEPVEARGNGQRILHTKRIPIFDKKGEPLYILGISEDITERKRAEREILRHKTALAREEVLAMVSHDLRSPLTAVTLAGQQLARSGTSPLERALAARIITACERMDRLTADILEVLSLQSGTLTLRKRPERASSLLDEVCEMLTPLAEQSAIRLLEGAGDGLPETLFCDRTRVMQALSNLVTNALKFTPKGGCVTVDAKRRDGEVLFIVEDTGSGIPEADKSHVFERFWTGREVTTRGSAGLGLAIVKAVVEAHGGNVGVEARDGVGAAFWFSLPRPRASESN